MLCEGLADRSVPGSSRQELAVLEDAWPRTTSGSRAAAGVHPEPLVRSMSRLGRQRRGREQPLTDLAHGLEAEATVDRLAKLGRVQDRQVRPLFAAPIHPREGHG